MKTKLFLIVAAAALLWTVPTTAPAQKIDYPYARPVPGKPGFVTSP